MREWRGPIAALIVMTGLVATPTPAQGQVRDWTCLAWVNYRLSGHVDDYTHNHGEDRRLYSPILGRKRDLYVYTPPGYDPRRSYPVVLYLHMAYVDEHTMVGSPALLELDRMIRRGDVPPMIVACPDGMYSGENRIRSVHSLYVNGRGGRFEDHLIEEVLPFLMSHYSIRPERQAHAILGMSSGGLGGMSIAIRRRDLFGAVATLAGPVNLRYDDARSGGSREDFNPTTYRWKQGYDPNEVYGVFYFGLRKTRVRKYIEPVFGSGPQVADILRAINPADLLFTTDLKPGELALYCHFPGRDNWNFDAHAMSFAWLAAHKGVHVELATAPLATHSLHYFKSNQGEAFQWLGRHVLPPSGPWVLAEGR